MSTLRTKVIRLASIYPKGSEERKALLSTLRPTKKALVMDGNPTVLPMLNALLRRELTVINQYMVQHALCDNWGYTKLANILKAQAITEMKHAETLIERFVYLEGIPEVGQLQEVHIGSDVPSILANNWKVEREAVALYNKAIALCYQVGDNGTRTILEPILADEEKHLDDDQARIEQIKTMGLENFLAEQTD